MGARFIGILMVAALTPVGCQTASTAGSSPVGPATSAVSKQTKAAAQPVLPATVLPATFGSRLEGVAGPLILVPAGMLSVAEVTRPRAEVRRGPGVQYELADKVLAQGTGVLVFNKVGVWRKVVVMATSLTGWVHGQALSEPKSNAVPMRVDVRRLPTVLALRDLTAVQSFPTQDPLAAKVPRGAMFRSLRYAENDNLSLVWLPETDSVMWMSRKDVQ